MANQRRRVTRPTSSDNGQVHPNRPTVAQLRGKKPLRITESFVLDQDKAERLAKARMDLEMAEARFKGAQKDGQSEAYRDEMLAALDAAADEYDEAQAEAADVVVEFVFQGIGKPRLDALRLAHPPTEDDKAKAKAKGVDPNLIEWHDETYTPELIVASMVEPTMTLDEFLEIVWHSDNWNEAERERLLMSAMQANRAMSKVDLGKAFARAYGLTSGSESSRDSAIDTASPAASS